MTLSALLGYVVIGLIVSIGALHTYFRYSLYRHLAQRYPEKYQAEGKPSWLVRGYGRTSYRRLIKRLGAENDDTVLMYKHWLIITEVLLIVLAVGEAAVNAWVGK